MSNFSNDQQPRLANYKRAKKPISRTRFRVRRIGVGSLGALVLTLLTFTGFTINRMQTDQLDFATAASDVAREIGLGTVVAMAEDFYYQSFGAPKVGGQPTEPAAFNGAANSNWGKRLVGKASANPPQNFSKWPAASAPSNVPDRIPTLVAPKPNEGVWVPTKITVNGVTAVYVARVRPDKAHTSVYATVAWFDPHLLAFREIPGTTMPEGNFARGDGRVPKALRPFYMAGFASGYHLVDAQGGFSYNGVVVKKLVNGKASLVTYPDGTMRIVQWGGEAVAPGYNTVRQNLDLLVDHGVSQVLDESQAKWGLVWLGTGSGKNYIWRSAIGTRADGSVVYVQGEALSAKSLAELLVRAGAVEGMSLDMNQSWAKGFFYGPYGSKGIPINPRNKNSTTSFWNTSKRDYIAVFSRSPANG